MTAALFGFLSAAPAVAGPIEDAEAAFYAQDYAKALKIVQPLAEKGDPAAMNRLAVMYEMGRGVPADMPKAVSLYKASAKKNYADAQNNMGILYLSGTGVEQNDAEALVWFERAALNGNNHGRVNAAVMYSRGKGTAPDMIKAYMYAALVTAPAAGTDTSFLKAPNNPRDEMAKQMTPEQIQKAEEKTKACFLSNYKKCD
jgi:TPR repeat protein